MEFVNLTPHTINVERRDGRMVEFPPSGTVARISMEARLCGDQGGIFLYRNVPGALPGLPDPVEGVWYITSFIVASAVCRPDVVSPGELIRGPDGQPIGCKGLQTFMQRGPCLPRIPDPGQARAALRKLE